MMILRKILIQIAAMILITICVGQVNSATLVHEWKFDESAVDTSGNGNDGVVSGTPSYVLGKFGQAISLALGQAVDDSTAAGLPTAGSSAWSINLWFKPAAEPAGLSYIAGFGGRAAGGGAARGCIAFAGDGNDYYFWGNTQDVAAGVDYDLNEWHMYTITYDGTKLYMYKDSGQVVSGFLSLGSASAQVGVGGTSLWGANVSGSFDEFTVWSGALDADSISNLYRFNTVNAINPIDSISPVLAAYGIGQTVGVTANIKSQYAGLLTYQWYYDADGLAGGGVAVQGATSQNLEITDFKASDAGYYNLVVTVIENSVSVASEYAQVLLGEEIAHWTLNSVDGYLDAAGNGNNAVVDDSIVSVNGIVNGDAIAGDVANGASLMAWQSGLATVAGFNPFANTGLFTISVWVKPALSSPASYPIASITAGNQSLWMLYLDINNMQVEMNSDGNISTDAAVVDYDEWYHIAATFDGSVSKIYVNGILEVESTSFDLSSITDATFRIGRSDDVKQHFAGGIDDMKMFNYPLSQKEVLDIYYAETGHSGCIEGITLGYDLTGDCNVNLYDLSVLASSWTHDGFYGLN